MIFKLSFYNRVLYAIVSGSKKLSFEYYLKYNVFCNDVKLSQRYASINNK